MPEFRALKRNWRDADPHVGHDSAVIWTVFDSRRDDDPAPHACLEHVRNITRHAVQGGMASNLHEHANVEQYYYVLAGRGKVLIGDETFDVRAGSVAYLPPGVPHQLLAASGDDWIEHLVVSCRVEPRRTPARVVNWREVKPSAGAHRAAVIWYLLERLAAEEPATDLPCLLGFHYLTRQALVRGKASDRHQHDDKEQLYYVLEGRGKMTAGDELLHLAEGDVVYLPKSVPHQIFNEDWDGWLAYLIIS